MVNSTAGVAIIIEASKVRATWSPEDNLWVFFTSPIVRSRLVGVFERRTPNVDLARFLMQYVKPDLTERRHHKRLLKTSLTCSGSITNTYIYNVIVLL